MINRRSCCNLRASGRRLICHLFVVVVVVVVVVHVSSSSSSSSSSRRRRDAATRTMDARWGRGLGEGREARRGLLSIHFHIEQNRSRTCEIEASVIDIGCVR